MLSHNACILHEVLFLEDVEYCECGSTGEMIATEGGTELSVNGFELWCYEYTTHRETVGDALSYRYDVGTDA